jgi:hypothetical protein
MLLYCHLYKEVRRASRSGENWECWNTIARKYSSILEYCIFRILTHLCCRLDVAAEGNSSQFHMNGFRSLALSELTDLLILSACHTLLPKPKTWNISWIFYLVSLVYRNLINLKFVVSLPAKGRFRSDIRLRSSCFTPCCFKPSCQCTPLLNLHPLIFGVTALGWLRCATLVPSHSIIYYGNIIFDLRPLFQEHKGRKTRAWCGLQLYSYHLGWNASSWASVIRGNATPKIN